MRSGARVTSVGFGGTKRYKAEQGGNEWISVVFDVGTHRSGPGLECRDADRDGLRIHGDGIGSGHKNF